MDNYVFVDAQNLHLATTKRSWRAWKVDEGKLAEFLRREFGANRLMFFIGQREKMNEGLYDRLARAGYEIVFREQTEEMSSEKKGNVDTDIVFGMMKVAMKEKRLGKIYLVSGDGDYFRTVKFLVEEGKFGKVLVPTRENASSLYKKLGSERVMCLSKYEIREQIEYKEWRNGKNR